MRGTLLATKEQQQSLIEQGMVKNLQQEKNEYVAPVTVGDIKISPMEMVVDDYFAFISFKVEGFELAEGEEPCFEKVKASLVNGEKYMVNLGGSFYYGVVPDENGKAVYEDGTPMEVTEDGEGIYHYEAADGSLEFVMTLQHADINESLIGKTVHISFENIGIAQKTTVVDREIGKWEFDIPLSGKSAGEIYEIGTQLEGTVFTVDSIELSPISARVNYTVNEDASLDIGYNRVPEFAGVLLKDGKERKYLSNAGKSGYTDDAMQKAFDLKSFVRVIDLDQVEAVFIREFKKSGEIELHVIYFEEDKSF